MHILTLLANSRHSGGGQRFSGSQDLPRTASGVAGFRVKPGMTDLSIGRAIFIKKTIGAN
jgi:hypothetical protein